MNADERPPPAWLPFLPTDVGGGSVPDTEKHSLARIPLRWMIREVFRTNTGIRFHAELLKDIGLDPASLWPHPKPACKFGPGLAHAPQIAPIPNPAAPWISLDPPTPPERSRVDVERRVVQAQAIFTDSPPQGADSDADAAGRPASPPPVPPSSEQAHARQVSVSTTRTLVGTVTTNTSSGTHNHNLLHPDSGPDPEGAAGSAVDELEEERKDAECPLYDQLSLKPWWWILEFIPIEQRKQLKSNKWTKYAS